MKHALYVGRFQLFHKGHLSVVRFIDSEPDIDKIIIAVGSSQFSHLKKSPKWPWANNPFTYEERKEMLTRSLEGEVSTPFEIHPVPDYFDWPRWYQHIQDDLPKTDVLYTSDRAETEFFSSRGYEVRPFPITEQYHAQILRERVYKGQDISDCLAKVTIEVYDRIGGAARIKELFARDIALKLKESLR